MANGSQPTVEPSLTSLLGGIVNDAKDLLLQEVALTKLEVREELDKVRTAAIAVGIEIGVLAAGGMLLMLMLVQVLAAFTEIALWGCYGIVGSVLVVVGGALHAAGKHQAGESGVAPHHRAQTIKENAQWLAVQTTTSAKT
jgi:Putative Actinobacterial Holin-X, holin superfamily III